MNWRAKPLVSDRVIVDLIGATTIDTGLTVHCELDTGRYPKGIAVTDQEWLTSISFARTSTASGTTSSSRDDNDQIEQLIPDKPLDACAGFLRRMVPITPVSPAASSKRDDGSGMAAVGGPTGGPPGNWSPVTVYVKD